MSRLTPFLLVGALVLGGCGGGSGSGTNATPTPAPVAFDNMQATIVNGGPDGAEVDTLYTSVTICVPGTTQCQTISDIAVDTGSVGLRLLASAVTLALPAVPASDGSPLANCVSFADLSFAWGAVTAADIQMGDEKAASVPIQLIASSQVPAAPKACSNGGTAIAGVADLGGNGLLGLGVFRQDCGPACAVSGNQLPPLYFSCPGANCHVATAPLTSQLQNPVWRFPEDNNGLLVSLPAVPDPGATTVAGSLVFGIGTRANNGPGAARAFTTNDFGNFTTVFRGQTFTSSYIDSGSTGLFFLNAAKLGIPTCPGGNDGYYCPASTTSFTGTTTGANGVTQDIPFKIANANALGNGGQTAFNDLAGPDGTDFDWGLPFFFGRNVFIGIEGQSSPLGFGPYWAF